MQAILNPESRLNIMVLTSFILLFTLPFSSYSLTIEDALQKAIENLPQYRAKVYLREKQLYEYRSTISGYLPSLDLSLAQRKLYEEHEDYDSTSLELKLSYILYDGGKRLSQRISSKTRLQIAEEDLRRTLIEVNYNVKLAFFNALARREILYQRKAQLEFAQKNYEVARGRYEFGVARLSDTLQASVRLEEAKARVVEAEGELKKALAELGSLIGMSVKEDELEGELSEPEFVPEKSSLIETAEYSPEVKIKKLEKELSLSERRLARSDFFPSIYLDATYTKNYTSPSKIYPDEEKTIGVRLTLNIFELKKFFKLKATEHSINAAQEEIKEAKRIIELNISRVYEDLLTALKRLEVAKEQLRFAEKNYEQAFGEYKVGKGDILSLISAESLLADAKEGLINSRLNIWISIINLEKTAGSLSEEYDIGNGREKQ